jgi:cytochrome P450
MLNLNATNELNNPFPAYKILRESPNLTKTNPNTMWTLSRYDEVMYALKNPDMFSSAAIKTVLEAEWLSANCRRHLCLVYQDPPSHTKYRALLAIAFSNIHVLAPLMLEKADRLIDRAIAKPAIEVLSEITFPYSSEIIGSITGTCALDCQSTAQLFEWAKLMETLTPVTPEAKKIQALEVAILSQKDYFDQVISETRRNPKGDFLDSLVHAEIDGETLSDDMLSNALDLLIRAGLLSTANTLATSIYHLSRYPQLLVHLKNNIEHIPLFINEIFRFYSPALGLLRQTTKPINIRDTIIPNGETVLVLLGSANHDPLHFQCPENFDIQRNPSNHLAFGAGPHACLGAALARLELKIALEVFISKVNSIDCLAKPQWKKSYLVRSLQQLQMSFN